MGDKGGLAQRHHLDLLHDVVNLILSLVEVNDFDRNHLARLAVLAAPDLAKGAAADALM